MSDNIERIKRRVAKILALAGNNPSEAERNSAMAMAQKMMLKYNLSMEDVIGEGGEAPNLPPSIDMTSDWSSTSWNPALRFLKSQIAKLYLCDYMFAREPNSGRSQANCFIDMFVGTEANRFVAKSVADFVAYSIIAESRRERRALNENGAFERQFMNTAAYTAGERAKKMRQSPPPMEGTGTALAVVNVYDKMANAIQSYYQDTIGKQPDVDERKHRGSSGSYTAIALGHAYGSRIHIGQVIEKGESHE